MDTSLFHFLRPEWLYALIPLALLCAWLWQQTSQSSAWRKVVSAELLPYLLVDNGSRQRRWPLLFILLAGVLAILAMAGPTWERLPKPVFRDDAALVIVLDLSRSMDTQDIKPSRIQRAHFKVTDIIKARTEGQTALIVYAADAFTVTPLTDDGQTIISQLGALTTDLMPAQGSRIDLALELASNLLRQAGLTQGDILLITDEVLLTTGIEAARAVNQKGYRLSILGVGTAEGAPIPLQGGGMLKDPRGTIVIPKLNTNHLQKIAAAGGGRYETLSTSDNDLERLDVSKISRLEDAHSQSNDLTAEVWKEFGPWLLLPVLLLAALAFRRGILILVFVFFLPLPQPANASGWSSTWQNLWQTSDQQAQQLMQQKDPEAAARQFKDPAWKASAEYQSGNYEDALENFQSLQGPEARYNEGNTLARLGELEAAIKNYDEALKLDPDHEDAKFNRKLIEDALKKQQEQNKQQQQQQQQQQSKDSSDQDQSDSNQSEQEKSENDQKSKAKQDQSNTEQNKSSEQQASDSDQADKQAEKDRQDQSAAEQQGQKKEQGAQQKPAPQSGEQDNARDRPDEKLMSTEAEKLDEEERLAREQWLKRIPDDPAELLKRKFKYQYQQRNRKNSGEQTW